MGDAVAFFGVSEPEPHDIVSCLATTGRQSQPTPPPRTLAVPRSRQRYDARPMLLVGFVAASVAALLLMA